MSGLYNLPIRPGTKVTCIDCAGQGFKHRASVAAAPNFNQLAYGMGTQSPPSPAKPPILCPLCKGEGVVAVVAE
ncbi:MAG: hypothetical protein ABJA82_00670 [Myxococcales bacterium]